MEIVVFHMITRFCIVTVTHFLMQLHIYIALNVAERDNEDEAGAEWCL